MILTYPFPEDLNLPMYEYLYQCIKDDILSGRLVAKEKLPSKRVFAKQQQVSLITIENCYNQLIMEGYIYAEEKKGYFVSSIEVINKELKRDSEPQKPVLQKSYKVDLANNSILEDGFPFDSFAKITRRVLMDHPDALMQRGDKLGVEALRIAISDHLRRFKGFNVVPEQIIIGAGSDNLYNLITQMFGQNHHFAIENPGHKTIAHVYEANHVPYTSISLDESGLNICELVSSNADIVHVSCTHHFPTGITMPVKRRLELLNWANKNSGYIIEDDYDSEFRMKGKTISPLFAMDNEHVIYLNTFTKTLSPSFRIAYMVLPKALLDIYQSRVGFYSCSVSVLDQLILAEFIKNGQFERHINRMRNRYRKIRNELLKGITNCDFYHNIIIKEENAGLHFLLQYNSSLSEREMIQKADSIGLHISALSEYYNEPVDSKTLIINYSGLNENLISEAIDCLAQLFEE